MAFRHAETRHYNDRKRMVYDIMGMTIPYVLHVSQTKYWRGCINFNTLPYLLSCLLTDTIRQSNHSIIFQLTRPAQLTDGPAFLTRHAPPDA